MITTPALAAAFKLACTCPVRRHEWTPRNVESTRKDAVKNRERIQALLAEGLSTRRIAVKLQVSRTTVCNHVRAMKKEG
jgi:DNA-binding NarL/FixJ family response regulator